MLCERLSQRLASKRPMKMFVFPKSFRDHADELYSHFRSFLTFQSSRLSKMMSCANQLSKSIFSGRKIVKQKKSGNSKRKLATRKKEQKEMLLLPYPGPTTKMLPLLPLHTVASRKMMIEEARVLENGLSLHREIKKGLPEPDEAEKMKLDLVLAQGQKDMVQQLHTTGNVEILSIRLKTMTDQIGTARIDRVIQRIEMTTGEAAVAEAVTEKMTGDHREGKVG